MTVPSRHAGLRSGILVLRESGTRGERVEVRGERSGILIFLPLASYLLPLFRDGREE
jgi:hypothetical protein